MGKSAQHTVVCLEHDFDAWRLTRQPVRSQGPTLLCATGLFLLVHLGITRIVLVGVDMAPGDVSHYYDEYPMTTGKQRLREWEAAVVRTSVPAWRRWLNDNGIEWVRLRSTAEHGFHAIPQVPR